MPWLSPNAPLVYHQFDGMYWAIRNWQVGIYSRPGTDLCRCGHIFNEHGSVAGYDGAYCYALRCDCELWRQARMLTS